MPEISRLTPLSRGLITLAIVGGVFFLIKTFVAPKHKSDDNMAVETDKKSDAPVLLKLSGSSTLGAKMMPELVKQFMILELNAENVSIQKVNENEINVVGKVSDTEKRINISTQGSSQGVIDAQNQKADLAMLSGSIDDLATEFELSNIALDGIAILVNRANTLKELTKTQVKDIFMGKITNWSQLGAPPAPINCYARSAQSGTFEAFKQLVLEQPTTTLPTTVTFFEDAKKLTAAIEGDPNGIGFSSFSAMGGTTALGLSDEGTTVQYPSVFTIETEDYLLARRLYLANLKSNKNVLAHRFIAFCKADETGQKVIAESGFVNMNLHNADTHTTIANAPPQYLSVTNAAKRLPTTLHFQSGSKIPDVRATDDIKRIITILSEPQSRQKQVELIGFTDNVGNPTANLNLSTERAQSIQAEFAKFGVKTQVYGFGQALPIASNKTPTGQNKNRRVEVWIK